MPVASGGPRLRLFGPDSKYGAKPKRTFTSYRWYIVWRDGSKRCELATGAERLERAKADKALIDFLSGRLKPRVTEKPVKHEKRRRDPSEVWIADLLTFYADNLPKKVKARERVAYAIDALLTYWGDKKVSDIHGETCREYAELRKLAPRRDDRKQRGDTPLSPKAHKDRADNTIRRELGVLESAGNFYVREGWLIAFPPMTLPEPGPIRERWLTRKEVAALIRAARTDKRARPYLPLYILIGLYTGARPGSIFTLQVRDNTTGDGVIRWDDNIIDFLGFRNQTSKTKPKIQIPRRLRRFLNYARPRVRRYIIETKRRYRGPDGKVVQGEPIKDIGKSFASAAKLAGLGEITPYTLRHTTCTWMKQRGIPSWDVAQFVGTSEEMIERHYGHHDPHHSRATAAFD